MTLRERRYVLIGAAIVSLAVAGRAAAAWHAEWAELSFRLVSEEGLVQSAHLMEKELSGGREHARSRDSLATARALGLLDAGDEATATLRLAERVATYVDDAGLEITSVLPEADSVKVATIRRLSIRAHLSGDLQALRSFLVDAMQPAPLLTIGELTIRMPGSDGGTPGELLDVDVLISGWYRERQP